MSDLLIESIQNETHNVKWFYDQFKSGNLEIDDSFQRKFVWVERHQIKLIETILIGYPIPEVYIWKQDTNPETGDSNYSIIDGQQRLSSVKKFIDNEFKLKASELDSNNKEFVNKTFEELSGELKRRIWSFPFSVRFMRASVERDKIVKMFLRLNETSMTLNPQELRHAEFDGEFIQVSSEIADHKFWKKYSLFNSYDIRRMLDVQFVSSILMFFRMGIESETTQTNINKLYDMYNDAYEEKDEDKKLFFDLIEYAEEIVRDHKQSQKLISRKTHLYSLFTLLYVIKKEFNELKENHTRNYHKLAESYDSVDKINDNFSEKDAELIVEYKELVQQGTKSKANRQRRFEILKTVII